MLKKLPKVFSENSKWLLIALGSLSWSWTMVRSGLPRSYGLGFWGPNGHDGVWHIALANSLKNGSLEMPIMSGLPIMNYHIGFDLLLALLSKVSFIPVQVFYFQILPILFSVLIGFFTYKFVFEWVKNKEAALWSTFFVYFGGSLGWIVTYIRDKTLGGESVFWSQQSISTLINPPFALSTLVTLVALNVLLKIPKSTKPILHTTFCILLFGILIEIKAYAGVLVIGSLFTAGIYEFITTKKTYLLKISVASTAISILLFIPLNSSSGKLLVYEPFWFLETMMQLTDRVGWVRFGEAMMNYRLGGEWLKYAVALVVSLKIFLIGNFGTRLVGLFLIAKWLKNYKSLSPIEIFFMTLVSGGLVLPMIFLQEGTPWNTIQFFYYTLIFLGILAGIAFTGIINLKTNKNYKKWLVAGIIIFTIPTTLSTLKDSYIGKNPPSALPGDELEALTFLKKSPPGVVLTYPFGLGPDTNATPMPLYIYTSTAYVSAFSEHPVFLEDEINLSITGYDWPTRRSEIEEFLVTLDQEKARKFLSDNNIEYIYWLKGQRAKLGETQLGIERFYENKSVDIYRVVKK